MSISTFPPNKNVYMSPIATGKPFKILSYVNLFSEKINSIVWSQGGVLASGVITVTYNDWTVDTLDGSVDNTYYPKAGIFTLVYDGIINVTIGEGDNPEVIGYPAQCKYTIYSAPNIGPPPRWNARTVIERALAVAETLTEGEKPRFKLNEEQAKEFEKIEVPEFFFTQSTLREILQDVGKYVHGEPRLSEGVIYYDMYGSGVRNSIPVKNYAAQTFSQTIDQHATKLKSNVDNLINTLSATAGAVTEPYFGQYNGFKTLRTETLYARIEDGTAIIRTEYPIYTVTELRWRGNEKTGNQPVDITPYVFESTEYERLSSYDNIYPTSRKYALYYTQGERNIKGLWFKRETAWGQPYEDYAITAILRAASQVPDISFTEVDTAGDTASTYPVLAFQITYVPIYSALVGQTKSYINQYKKPIGPITLAYNQGQNLVESSYYGENLKGVIARIGNVEKTVAYVRWGMPLLPNVGDMYDDDYYISSVVVEYQPYTTKVILGLTQDFNRLSQYVGINSQKRFYEVSERQAIDSHVSYTDYVVIGSLDTGYTDGDQMFDFDMLLNTFEGDSQRVTCVLARGYDSAGNALNRVLLPVQSAAIGNSAVFTAKYEDNYSAGQQANVQTVADVTGYWANGVAYKDVYGNMEYLELNYQRQIFSQSENSRYLLPAAGDLTEETSYLYTKPGKRWHVKIGSAEVPTIDYQIDYVTNRKDIIIGPELIARNPLIVSSTKAAPSLYILPYRLNKFAKAVDLSTATLVGDVSAVVNPNFTQAAYLQSSEPAPVDGVAWAITDGDGNLLLGCNRKITQGDSVIVDVNIMAAHKIF